MSLLRTESCLSLAEIINSNHQRLSLSNSGEFTDGGIQMQTGGEEVVFHKEKIFFKLDNVELDLQVGSSC